ncbi:MAG: asparagine synthase-related protein [Vulcanimicrobiota bacterium]
MCGIVGVLSDRPIERWRLRKALQSMQRRGPDDQGEWWSQDGCVGLGHRRLAIDRAARSDQPVAGERCRAVVNGEFYGLAEEFKDCSDSWALPVLYRRHGLSGTLDRLRGEFAFLLYDEQNRQFLAVRDRFGVKPLYYARREKEWWFASKPSALWAAGILPGWCQESFVQAAHTQYPPPGHSLFAGIRTVPPAHVLSLPGPRIHRYWQIPPAIATVTPDDLLVKLRESVALRVRRGAPSAVLLSGGVDSAGVAALAAETGEDVKAFTVDFTGGGTYSEGAKASRQAGLSGLSHHLVSLSPKDILRGLPEAVRLTEGLCVNGHLVAKLKLAEAVSADGRQVLLTGEGADELLFGYRHFAPYFGQEVNPLTDSAGLGILTTLESSPLARELPAFFHSKWALGRRICQLLGLPHQAQAAFEKMAESSLAESPLENARQAWIQTALVSYILEVLGDATEMAHSVEGRPPYLDHHLWEIGMLPPDCDKSLLRSALSGLVTEDILRSGKHPFMSPALGQGLLDALHARVEEEDHPFLDRKAARRTLSQVKTLQGAERLSWEPALLWVLSSYFLQRSFMLL